jgi:hypothetical protein
MSEVVRCKECVHFAADAGGVGSCRRYPPTKPANFADEPWQFPIVHEDGTCGEASSGS